VARKRRGSAVRHRNDRMNGFAGGVAWHGQRGERRVGFLDRYMSAIGASFGIDKPFVIERLPIGIAGGAGVESEEGPWFGMETQDFVAFDAIQHHAGWMVGFLERLHAPVQ